MRHLKIIALLTALLLCVCLTAAALTDGPLSGLWDSGCDLLFHTDNVTVTGEAVFSLDGVRFKTANLHYVQDGYRSFYDLDLHTPRKSGIEQETGWTIIADEEGNYNVMEVYEPGVYRTGFGNICNSLLRRSYELDMLTELCGILVGQVEPLLPADAVTVSEAAGGKTIRLTLAGDQVPAVAQSALSLGFTFLSNRWFISWHDRTTGDDEYKIYDNYVSVTQALTDGTVRWTLDNVDAAFTLDDQGRITAAEGSLAVTSTFVDGVERQGEVSFSLAMTDYGTSAVKLFDPDDYGVSLPVWYSDWGEEEEMLPLDEETMDEMLERAESILESQGYTVSPEAERGGWWLWDLIQLEFDNPDGDQYCFTFTTDGDLWDMENPNAPWHYADLLDVEGVEEETIAAAKALAASFLQEQCPGLAEFMDEFEADAMMTVEGEGQYLQLYDFGSDVLIVIRIDPSLRVEYFAGGGNG